MGLKLKILRDVYPKLHVPRGEDCPSAGLSPTAQAHASNVDRSCDANDPPGNSVLQLARQEISPRIRPDKRSMA